MRLPSLHVVSDHCFFDENDCRPTHDLHKGEPHRFSSVISSRIRHRVQVGGHDIRPEDVERRFSASISALGEVLSYTHEAVVLDNTDGFVHLAAWKNGTLCWWSPEKAKAHPWFARAIQRENWRE